MIYIAHGNNLPALRKLILNQQSKLETSNKTELDISNTSEEAFFQATHSTDMFGNSPFVILDISSAGRKKLNPYLDIVRSIPQDTTLIVLSSKKLSKANIFIKNAKELGAKIVSQDIPLDGNSFKFADAVVSKDRKKSYQQMKKLQDQGTSDFEIFGALMYVLTNVAKTLFESPSTEKLQGFIKSKSSSQAKKYTKKEMGDLFSELCELDKKTKTGEVPANMFLTMAVENILK